MGDAIDVETHLQQHQNKQLLRFVAVGSVDDGKSTLIGRLLHDTQGVYEDQLSAVKAASKRSGSAKGEIDFALLTDGLKAEREQGITIDVAYRYFSTEKRKFIIADTPGHVQYTRNMATGASTADVAIILIDVKNGVLQQSRRHAYIASLLGIPSLAVCINKMDLVDFDRARYEQIVADFERFAQKLSFERVRFFPVSAVDGDNIVTSSGRADWYTDGTLLSFLETVPLDSVDSDDRFRFPVQYVLRPNSDYRGFAGRIASGAVRPGDEVTVVPSGKTSRVKAVDSYHGQLDEAFAPMSISIRLQDEVDISRGDMLVHHSAPPTRAQRVSGHLIWMSETPLDKSRGYFLKHTTRRVRASIESVEGRLNLDTLDQEPTDVLQLNDIGRVVIACNQPLFCEPYRQSRALGSFILIDALSNNTVAAGMIEHALRADSDSGTRLPKSAVSAEQRQQALGHSAAVVAFAGGEESAASSQQENAIAYELERQLFALGCVVTVIDVPQVADATRSAALLSDIAAQCVGAGAIVVFSQTLPRLADRTELRRRLGDSCLHTFAANPTGSTEDEVLRLDAELERAVSAIIERLREAGTLAAVH